MCSPRTYEDILANILEKRHSRCVCPEEYLTPPLPRLRSKPTTPCQFGPNCQFEMQPGQTTTCAYDATVCTCVQCTCGVDFPPNAPTSAPQESPPKCEQSTCDCSYCACQPEPSSPNLLPTSFRTLLKREGRKMMTDQEMREERQAIKQLIDEVSEAPKDADVEVKKVAKRNKSKSDVEDSGVKEEPKQVEDSPKQSLKSSKGLKVSIAVPAESSPDNKTNVKKQSTMLSRETSGSPKKSKKVKSQKSMITPKSAKTVIQYRSRMRITEKKKPLRIRYYYAGDVENYGVKLGHANCLEKPVSVPKNMGWLWNIEDPSKGIRERKGWPPGFIGKNIKNMIQVMKMFASEDTAETGDTRELRRWKTQPDTRAERDEPRDEPPLLHIHKKGLRYDITFCPKNSDDDLGPVPIPFTITQKKRDGDSETDDSSLEFEFHSPKPRARWNLPEAQRAPSVVAEEEQAQPPPPPTPGERGAPKPPTGGKGKKKNKKSAASEENRNNWEDQPTQIENVPSSTVAGS